MARDVEESRGVEGDDGEEGENDKHDVFGEVDSVPGVTLRE